LPPRDFAKCLPIIEITGREVGIELTALGTASRSAKRLVLGAILSL
jgi:hypothetical protein